MQGAVRPVQIVTGLVLAQDPPQMILAPGEGAVQGAHGGIHRSQRSAIAFIRGVRTLQRTVWIPASARTASKAPVKSGSAVADHEFDPVSLLAEVHKQVPGPLGGPLPCWDAA